MKKNAARDADIIWLNVAIVLVFYILWYNMCVLSYILIHIHFVPLASVHHWISSLSFLHDLVEFHTFVQTWEKLQTVQTWFVDISVKILKISYK